MTVLTFAGLSLGLTLLVCSGVTMRQQYAQQTAIQEALRLGEAELRTMAATSPSILILGLSNGSLTYLSPRWGEFTGLTADQTLTDGWISAVHPAEQQKVLSQWSESISKKAEFDATYRLRRRDGTYHWVLAKTVPLLNQHGVVQRWCTSLTDVEKQKDLEEKLRSSNRELEHFAYAASHDLQEPLRNVTTSAQLLMRSAERLSEADHELLEFIVSSAKRMAGMVRGFLAYAKLEGADSEKPAHRISMNNVLRSALDNLRSTVSNTHAEVSHDPLPSLFWLDVPASQVLQNLIGNALKYRQMSKPPCIHVSCNVLEEETIFSVRDNGIGIPKDKISQVFWVFKRLHQDEDYEGTGLGLAFCKRIVERRGGRIWVESEEGVGSTFFFSIPHVYAEAGIFEENTAKIASMAV